MFFSVVIPVYNVEKYLRECIDSVLEQNFEDYEIILVNDGSKDSSGAICDEYAKKDNRIRVVHKENGGLSDARNAGTKAAKGDYIIYIDSDDYVIGNEFLADINTKISETNSDIVVYKFRKLYEKSGQIDECYFSYDFGEETADSDELLYAMVKKDAYYGMAWTKAFRRSFAVDFEKGLLGEDMDWFFHLLSKEGSIAVIDKAYIAYRQREGSITSTHKIKNLTDFIYILEKWSNNVLISNATELRKKAFLGAMAKYYSNLLIVYSRLKDKNKAKEKERIKALSFLLDYALSNRPLQIKKVYKLFGFEATILMLKIFDKIKG